MLGSGARPEGVVAIIPARFASSRFPGKPLVDLLGVPMVVRVARQVALAEGIDRVRIATDDRRIKQVVEDAGFEAVMTPMSCPSGTDRVALAAQDLGATRLIVNVQGDEPLIDPLDVSAVVEETLASTAPIGTLARPLDASRFHDRNVVKVVRDKDGQALYFSRAPIPDGAPELALCHLGIYAYRPAILPVIAQLPPSRLEQAERLEQLRWLENGIHIHVALARSSAPSYAIDAPEDVGRVIRELEARSDREQGTGNATG